MLRLCPFVVKEENANNLSPPWQGLAQGVPVHSFLQLSECGANARLTANSVQHLIESSSTFVLAIRVRAFR